MHNQEDQFVTKVHMHCLVQFHKQKGAYIKPLENKEQWVLS